VEKLFPYKQITKEDFSGLVSIEGDFQQNNFRCNFIFDKHEMVHPLIIRIKAVPMEDMENDSKELKYRCHRRDVNNPVMRTDVISPDFSLEKYEIKVIDVASHVSCMM